jgi:hypothetical protein
MIAPKIPLVRDGQILSTNLVNSMIGRIEYAADLLRQYKLIAGDEMYVEPHFDGTRVSYNQPVAGGATPTLPLLTESEKKLEDLLNGRVPMSEFSGYIFDAADIQNLYGQNARLWIQYSVGGTVIGGPQFTAFPVPGFQAMVSMVLGSGGQYLPINQSMLPPPPYNQLGLTTIVQFIEVSFGSSTSLQFKISTEQVNPFV